ncbi:ATP-binding cassette domain-containing protein [Negadavirga shengliensis]|uniref:ATP-binding cassette domain-containing protein n=1 Tax=Negadavirga shengliensis TaxID=1389218 RepID=A0ABV9T7C8_9BACT
MGDTGIFLAIHNGTVKHFGKTIFQQLDFRMKNGESWAILAASGAEKTAFLETLMGRTSLVEGHLEMPFARSYQEKRAKEGKINSFRDLVAMVSQKYAFRDKTNLQNFYYQQRFNSSESEEADTVERYLGKVEAAETEPWDLRSVMRLFRLELLKDKSLIKLSNGETRRLALAAGLLKNPKLFLMDMPMTGLDVDTRRDFGRILECIIRSGIQVVMTTTATEIPMAINKLGLLRNGRIEVIQDKIYLLQWEQQNKSNNLQSNGKLKELLSGYPHSSFSKLVKLNKVTIKYGDKILLDRVCWEVHPAERWLIKGHNGAGKSTLISLILGENPQAYANDMVLFDRKRGTGESIWDVKRPTGFVSPELSRYFPANQTCLKVVLSGLFDTVGLFKKVSAAEEQLAGSWLEAFDLTHVARLGLHQVSLEDQRFCLLARAMIKKPQLLVLDEAAQGMDEEQRVRFRNTVDLFCKETGLALIYVSHYDEDVPQTVDKRLVLEEGRVVS